MPSVAKPRSFRHLRPLATKPGEKVGLAPGTIRLVDVAEEVGVRAATVTGDGSNDYVLEANGNGVAILDYDGDGDRDLLLVSGSTLEATREGAGHPVVVLYRNEGGLGFRDVTAASEMAASGWGMGVCAGDVDADGAVDLYVTAYGRNLLWRNRGDGTFREEAERAGVADEGWSHSCAFGDYDGDGDLDLYVTNYVVFDEELIPPRGPDTPCGYMGSRVFCGPLGLTAAADALYENAGDGTFRRAAAAGVADAPPRYGLGVVFSDLDGDGWLDLFVSNDSQPNFVFHNRGDGGFEEIGLLAGMALSERGDPQASMGIAVGDYDRDGDLDAAVTNFSQDYNTLYRNHGGGFFADVSLPANVANASMDLLGWGTLLVDLDHDGWQDLFVANGHVFDDVESFGIGSTYRQPNQLFRNLGDGSFEDVSSRVGSDLTVPKSSRGAAAGDLDSDGDLDLVVTNMNDRPDLLRNEGGERRAWLAVDLRPAAGRADPVGTRILVTVEGSTQLLELTGGGSYLSHSDRRAHFGLGGAAEAERVAIRSPGAAGLTIVGARANLVYVVLRPAEPDTQGSSVPSEEHR